MRVKLAIVMVVCGFGMIVVMCFSFNMIMGLSFRMGMGMIMTVLIGGKGGNAFAKKSGF